MIGPIKRITREEFVGIDISDSSMEAVVLNKKGRKRYKVVAYSRFRLSPGIVEDGFVIQPDKLKEAVQKLLSLAKPRRITTNNVFLAIPESKVFSHVFALPKNLKHKDLLTAATTKAEEFVPESTDNLMIDLKVLPVKEDKMEVFYTAAKKDTVQEFIKLFEGMGMDIIGITVESLATFAGLADELKQKETLLLDIGARTSIASIFDKNGIRDSINIPIAGNHITDAIVQRLNISHTDAESKKRQFGMDSSIAGGEVMLVIQGQMQPVADELKRFVHYYEEFSGHKLEQLVLTGGTAQIKGLDKYFGDNLNLAVSLASPFIKDKNLPERLQSTKYISALGLAKLALQKKWEINFYQTERMDLQQEVTAENLMTWLKVIGRFFLHIPKFLAKVFRRWYITVPIILIILGVLGWQFKDKLTSSLPNANKIFTEEIVVSLHRQDISNYIPAELVNYSVESEGIYPGLTYQVAVKELKKSAIASAEADSFSLANSQQSVIPQIVSINNLIISPSQAELLAQASQSGNPNYILSDVDILTITGQFGFLAVNNQTIKGFFLSDLSLSEAEDLNSREIVNIQHQIVDFDRKNNSFTLKTKLELAKLAEDNSRWYWPF